MRIDVPRHWLTEGAELELVVPRILSCDHCDGGGCEGCGKSGALRAPEAETARTLRLGVPSGHERAVQLRLVDPFDGSDVSQLIVEIHAADAAAAGVRRIEPLALPRRARVPRAVWGVAAMLLLLALWLLAR